jgi:2-polyprenyl-6-hydroxyphenyl methylase/3-demethylubiquinone-9 3-methyltransferase
MKERSMRYPAEHWIRSADPEQALSRYLDQQGKAYSRVKNLFIREMIGDLGGKTLLDYGCGAGFFAVYAAKSGAQRAVGVDAEQAVLSTAAYFADREGVADRCEWVLSDRFPSSGGQAGFDVILLKDVIEHVEDDEGLLAAVRQSLAPGGVLIVSTQNAASLNFLTEGLYHRCLRGEKGWFGWDETHLRFYTPSGLGKKLRRCGWRPLAWRSNYLVPHKFPGYSPSGGKIRRCEALSRVDLLMGRHFPWNRLGWNIIVKAAADSPTTASRRNGMSRN